MMARVMSFTLYFLWMLRSLTNRVQGLTNIRIICTIIRRNKKIVLRLDYYISVLHNIIEHVVLKVICMLTQFVLIHGNSDTINVYVCFIHRCVTLKNAIYIALNMFSIYDTNNFYMLHKQNFTIELKIYSSIKKTGPYIIMYCCNFCSNIVWLE